jgi:psp operon transcriptional activator
VRELKNVVERAVYRSDSPAITDIIFDPFVSPHDEYRPTQKEVSQAEDETTPFPDFMNKPLNEAVRELKVQLLNKALRKARFNQRKAARILGLTYHQFRGLYRKYREEID